LISIKERRVIKESKRADKNGSKERKSDFGGGDNIPS
jgi:hypothetical protein